LLGRSLRDNARCAGYAFAASLRDLLGRSLRDNARCAGYAIAASLRDWLGRSLRDNARCAGYAFAASLRDWLGRSLFASAGRRSSVEATVAGLSEQIAPAGSDCGHGGGRG
jgi:hypothetical protein